jgi:putative glycerol-1-phosphate prenyltransferase
MHTTLYHTILHKKQQGNKQFALLIDPDKYTDDEIITVVRLANSSKVDFFLIGGSLVSVNLDNLIITIKKWSAIPVILYPGSLLQLSPEADGIFLLSLISGRNPEFLIGNHVVAAPLLKKSGIEVIATGYVLIDGNNRTSVEYMSNTTPIPSEKTDIIVATAIAGEMLGMKMIYLEAGSGASNHISEETIRQVRKNIQIPLIVGGGIQTPDHLADVYTAGADIVVVGTAIEHNTNLIAEMAGVINN